MTDTATKPKISKPKRLSKKEKGFVKDYAATGNGTEAAIRNYDTESRNVAGAIAAENLTKPRIINALADAIPDELLKDKHLALLNRMEVVAEQDPNTKKVMLVPTNQINIQAVSKGLELAYKIKGAFIDPADAPSKPGNTYNFFYKPEIKATTDKYEEELKQILYKDAAKE